MGDLISLRKAVSLDPILQKGDVVKLLDESDDLSFDVKGIVIGIESVFGPDHQAAGQASIITVGLPYDDGWETLEGVALENIHRIIGRESDELRGYVD